MIVRRGLTVRAFAQTDGEVCSTGEDHENGEKNRDELDIQDYLNKRVESTQLVLPIPV